MLMRCAEKCAMAAGAGGDVPARLRSSTAASITIDRSAVRSRRCDIFVHQFHFSAHFTSTA